MNVLEKLRAAFEVELANARNKRAQAVTTMCVADAEIQAAANAIDRIEKVIAEEEQRAKKGAR